jgi:hypothetical protein
MENASDYLYAVLGSCDHAKKKLLSFIAICALILPGLHKQRQFLRNFQLTLCKWEFLFSRIFYNFLTKHFLLQHGSSDM